MGNLSNLYISKSFQSLIHLGSDSVATSTTTLLQDGYGNSIGVGVNTAGDLFLSGSLTASLQQGYIYVGNSNGKTTAFSTASLVTNINTGSLVTTASFNQYTSSNDSKWNNLASQSGSWITESETGSFVISSSFNSYTSSTNIRLNNLESTTASVNVSISNLNSTTASQAISITNLNAATQSLQAQLTTIGGQSGSWGGSSTNTGSLLVTASASATPNTITFTKGDASTFNVTLNITASASASFNTGSFATTGSNTFVGDQTVNAKLIISGSSNSYLQFTSPNSATGSGAIYFGNNGPYIQTYSNGANQDRQGLQLVAGLSGSFALTTRYGGGNALVDLYAQYDAGTAGTPYSRIRAFSNGAINIDAYGNQIAMSGSATVIQGVDFIPFSASLNSRINAGGGGSGFPYTGNAVISGSLYVSGSNQVDVIVESQLYVTQSNQFASGSTTRAQIVVAGPLSGNTYGSRSGSATLGAQSLSLTRGTATATLQAAGLNVVASDPANYIFGTNTSQFFIGTADNISIDNEINFYTDLTGTAFRDWDNNIGDYSAWMTLQPNDGVTIPIPQFTRGLGITGSLTIESGSSFYANGHKQFNVGAFQSNVTQSGSANVSQSMNFGTTDISQGVSIVSNSRITLANAGTYNIQFSAQIDRISGSGTDTVNIWLKKNGVNVAASAGAITISGGALAAKAIAAWNYVVNAAANDYYELAWQTTDTNIQLINVNATGNIPSIPSIILTVTQVR